MDKDNGKERGIRLMKDKMAERMVKMSFIKAMKDKIQGNSRKNVLHQSADRQNEEQT